MTWQRSALALLGLIASLILTPTAAHAGDGNDDMAQGSLNGDGATVRLQRAQIENLRHAREVNGKASKASYEYDTVVACGKNHPGQPAAEPYCASAVKACAGNTPEQGQGPLAAIYRRAVSGGGKPQGQWELVGNTCFPDLAPRSKVLSMAQIISAFRRTPFAKPTLHIQPEGNTTLVTLPTYFQATWPAQGFQPGEVDTADPAQMLGHTVRIRPLAASYTYTFGDGTDLGPTSSPGGTYPDGDVTHTYDRAGTYPTRIAVTYGGEFSLDGGPWIRIPATATITGPTQALQVKTAHNRLYDN